MDTRLWVLAMVFFIPAMLMFFGLLFQKKPPRRINRFFGYRTSMSTKNMTTWAFAQKYSGRLYFRFGLAMLPCSAVPLLLVWGQAESVVMTVGLIVLILQTLAMFLPIARTERALKRAFDRNGNPR